MKQHILQEQLEIIQAAIDGKAVQWRDAIDGGLWIDKKGDNFNFISTQHRVKPAPRTWNASVNDKGFLITGHVTDMEHITVVELLESD